EGSDRSRRAPERKSWGATSPGRPHVQHERQPLDCRVSDLRDDDVLGWGGRIRTCGWRHQKPLPYHLATPHQGGGLIAVSAGVKSPAGKAFRPPC
nr:hypothetical protein [Tanacetum cinerariifolium]